MVFQPLTFARSRGRCWKPRPKAVIFNTSQRTWRMLMHWKTMFDHYYCIKTENISYISPLHYFVSPFHRCLVTVISTDYARAGLGGSVGCAVRLETRRSWVQPPPRLATFFRGDWSWNIFYGHFLPSADSRRAVVSFWWKNVHNTG